MRNTNFRNFGLSESEQLQNRFTHYLQTSVQRTRARYLQQLADEQQPILFADMPEDFDPNSIPDPYPATLICSLFSWQAVLDDLDDQDLRRALLKLSSEDTTLLLLHVILGYHLKEIAILLGTSNGEVESKLFTIIRKLRHHLHRE